MPTVGKPISDLNQSLFLKYLSQPKVICNFTTLLWPQGNREKLKYTTIRLCIIYIYLRLW